MIYKLRQPLNGKTFTRSDMTVIAIRVKEDFMFETKRGWQQGYKGQWLVECGEDMRCAMDDEAFRRHYTDSEVNGS